MDHTSPILLAAQYCTVQRVNFTILARHAVLLPLLILAACGGGGSGNSSPPPDSGTEPDTPSGVAISVGPTALNVVWNAVSGASSYRVYYSDTPGVTESSPSVTVTASPATISGLAKGATYYVRVSASNSAGTSALSVEQSARTSNPPDAVESFTVTPADGGALVSWDAIANADRYTVFASTVAGDVSNSVSVTTALLNITVEGLTNGTTYYVSVRAENIEGDAPRSAEQTVTPAVAANGLGWTQQTLINEPYDFFGRDNYLGGVAINDMGIAAAAWIFAGNTDGNNFVIVNHTTHGDWGAEEVLALNDNSQPQVAVAVDGTIVAAWVSHYLDNNAFRTGGTIVSRRYVNGTWTDPEAIADISEGTGDYVGAVALAADGAGNFIATWWQNQTTMWVNRFDGTSWGTPEQIGDSIRTLGPPAVGASAADEAIVVWLQDTEPYDPGQSAGGPSRRSLYASRFDGTIWNTSRVGHMDLTGFDGAERPRIDVNPMGSAVVVWQQTRDNINSDGFRIDGVRYDAATNLWSAPETLTARDWQVPWPDVAIDANGNAVASWQPTDLADNSSQRVLEAAFFDTATLAWRIPVAVNEDDGATEPDPLFIEKRESGDVFAVWDQQDGVFWRRYDATTETWDPITQLGIYDSNAMAMAMSRNGHTIVVTNPLIVSNNSFEHAVYALLYRP